MKTIEVKQGQLILSSIDKAESLFTINLGDNIAFTYFIKKSGVAGMAREISTNKVVELFQKLMYYEDLYQIDISVVGGNNSEKSKRYISNLIDALHKIDQEKNILNIVSWDVNKKIHPESFVFNTASGILYPLTDSI